MKRKKRKPVSKRRRAAAKAALRLGIARGNLLRALDHYLDAHAEHRKLEAKWRLR